METTTVKETTVKATTVKETATPQPKRVHLYVATPAYGCTVTSAYATSLIQLQGMCIRRGVECSVDMIGNESLVQRGRNILQARFLKSKATHLLFVDADIAFAPESVFKLLAAEKDVIAGVYAKKNINWASVKHKIKDGTTEPVRGAGLDYNINVRGESAVVDGVVEVLDAPTGFLLITREVIEKMWSQYADTLWCKNDIQGSTNVDAYCAIFDCMIDPESRRYLSEDYAFCRRWQQMGGRIFADVSFPLAHVGNQTFTGDIRTRLNSTASASGSSSEPPRSEPPPPREPSPPAA